MPDRTRPPSRLVRPPAPAPRPRTGADLHVHTTHSDGACSPCEVVVAAARVGLKAMAITDHDTVSAVAVARPEAGHWGVELIAGVEWTAAFGGREVHLLGHFMRDDDPAVTSACARLRAGRSERVTAITGRLGSLGLRVDLESLKGAFPRATLGRRHVAEWLTRSGQVPSVREAFARYLGDNGPANVPKVRLAWDDAIALTAAAGGVTGLAHPPYNLRREELKTLVDGGLAAIEVDGPGISNRLGQRWRAWAAEFDLVPICGSDFHTADRPGRWLGAVTTPDDALERLRTRAPGG